MLQIKDLYMSAGDFSVKDVNISVPGGSCHVLLGGTGNGKTLILETIAGLRPISNGEIRINDNVVTKLPPEKRFISYVPQDLALFPHLNVKENILFSQRFKKNKQVKDQEISDIIKSMQLEDIMNRTIHNLSGGEQQRVALARAFASGNRVLLLDEPFSALHYTLKRTLWSLLSDMKKRFNLAILMVTHDLDEAFFLADNISVLHQGRILQTGTKEEITKRPISIEVTKMTGHYNYFRAEVKGTSGNKCDVRLTDFEGELGVENNAFQVGNTAIVAIRTGSIKILPSCETGQNVVACEVKNVSESANYRQIVVVPEGYSQKSLIEIVIDDYGFNNKVEPEQKLNAYFPPEELLLFGC